jgi:hypothetical protein
VQEFCGYAAIMPVVRLNSAFAAIHGRLGGVVFKTYPGGKVVVTRVPRFEGYVPTPAQRARRERMAEATAYAQKVYSDAALKALYIMAAKRIRRQPFRLAISDHLAKEKLLEKSQTTIALSPAESSAIERLRRCGALKPSVTPRVASRLRFVGQRRPAIAAQTVRNSLRRERAPAPEGASFVRIGMREIRGSRKPQRDGFRCPPAGARRRGPPGPVRTERLISSKTSMVQAGESMGRGDLVACAIRFAPS